MTNPKDAEKLDRFIHRSSDQSMTVGDVPASPHNSGYVALPAWKREDMARRVISDAKAGRGTFSTPARRTAIASLQPDPVAIDPALRPPSDDECCSSRAQRISRHGWAAVCPPRSAPVAARLSWWRRLLARLGGQRR